MTSISSLCGRALSELPALFQSLTSAVQVTPSFFTTAAGRKIADRLRILEFGTSPFDPLKVYFNVTSVLKSFPHQKLAIFSVILSFFADSGLPGFEVEITDVLNGLAPLIGEIRTGQSHPEFEASAKAVSKFISKRRECFAAALGWLKGHVSVASASFLKFVVFPSGLDRGQVILLVATLMEIAGYASPEPGIVGVLADSLFVQVSALENALGVVEDDLGVFGGLPSR
jgi:hypothetical protein